MTRFDVKSKATALKALEDLDGIDWFDGPRGQRFYTLGTVQSTFIRPLTVHRSTTL